MFKILIPIVALLGLATANLVIENDLLDLDQLHSLQDTPVELPPEFYAEVQEYIKTNGFSASGITAIVNIYADKIFKNVQKLIVDQGLDPLALPDLHQGFKKKIIFITYTGAIDLTKGWLQDASTIQRGGDVVVSYQPNVHKLQIQVPVAFNDLMFTYDYSATFMGLGPRGGIDGKLSKLKINFALGIDFAAYNASIDTFQITNKGHIDLKWTGNILTDWLLNILTDVVSFLLSGVILDIVSGIIKTGLNVVVSDINAILHYILNPTTAAPIITTTLPTLIFS